MKSGRAKRLRSLANAFAAEIKIKLILRVYLYERTFCFDVKRRQRALHGPVF